MPFIFLASSLLPSFSANHYVFCVTGFEHKVSPLYLKLKKMSEEVFRIKSITQLHELVGAPKPNHPLISVVLDEEKGDYKSIPAGTSISLNLYQIWLKSGSCGVQYGRKHYDFEEGVMTFSPPNQVMTMTDESSAEGDGGWGIFFHPDLIRTSPLGEHIDDHSFFNYESHEALHLSDKEKKTLRDCVDNIIEEISDRIDDHSQRVIVSNLELLLNYCARYYDRQFNTRTSAHKAIVTQVDDVLKKYIDKGELSMNGQPSVNLVAERVNLSANYLSDLLKKETGRSAKDHINEFLIGRAKRALLTTQDSISEIAYELGFNYPHYFSRLFKSKTGLTPNEYRMQN